MRPAFLAQKPTKKRMNVGIKLNKQKQPRARSEVKKHLQYVKIHKEASLRYKFRCKKSFKNALLRHKIHING